MGYHIKTLQVLKKFKGGQLKKISYILLVAILSFCIYAQGNNICIADNAPSTQIQNTDIQKIEPSPVDDIANTPIEQITKKHNNALPSTGEVFANLITLVLIMLVLAWAYSKYGKKALDKVLASQQLKKNDIKILSTAPMGQNKFLHIVEVDGERVLIGSTNTQISLLKELRDIKQEKAVSDE